MNECDKEPTIYATMKMRFVGEHDGMCPVQQLIGTESALKAPPTAPGNGYAREYRFAEPNPDEDSYNAAAMLPKAYLLRIRTKVDADGKILSAQYGKIVRMDQRPGYQAPISIWALYGESDKPVISFASCYLNPTPNDRNVEYGGEHNLAPEIEDGYHRLP